MCSEGGKEKEKVFYLGFVGNKLGRRPTWFMEDPQWW